MALSTSPCSASVLSAAEAALGNRPTPWIARSSADSTTVEAVPGAILVMWGAILGPIMRVSFLARLTVPSSHRRRALENAPQCQSRCKDVSVPIEPPPTPWQFPAPTADADDAVALGADLAPGTMLAGYRAGLFPMHVEGRLAWWSPRKRGVLPVRGMRVTRSLRQSAKRFEIRVDTDFEGVLTGCADPRRSGAWINGEIGAAYLRLRDLGWVHSVEAWCEGELAGGLYGVAIG